MDEHGAGKDELFDGKALQSVQQSLGTTDGDFIIFRARLTGKVVICREMDHLDRFVRFPPR
jgi:hypothetical protein